MGLPSARWKWGGISILICAVAYTILAHFASSRHLWQELLLNLTFALGAGWSAWRASRMWRRFTPLDPPRRVWRFFALGLWFWTAAELLWAVMAYFYGEELPVITLADLCWVVGCLLLIASLAAQYRLLYRLSAARARGLLAAAVGLLLLLSGGVALLVPLVATPELSRGELFLLVFYPLADLLLAIGAWHIARSFGEGRFARVWYALFLFAVSDTLYTWLLSKGVYVLVGDSNFLTLLTDTLYLGAYLLLGWMCQAQEYLLLYGPRWRHLKVLPPRSLREGE